MGTTNSNFIAKFAGALDKLFGYKCLAEKALKDGLAHQQFNNAAQKHANNFWLFAILTVVAWWFSRGIITVIPAVVSLYSAYKSIVSTMVNYEMNRLINMASGNDGVLKKMEDIVRTYGDFLSNSAPQPGMLADESKLPYPKEAIKGSLRMAIRLSNDQYMIEHLRTAFILLNDWQPGVGDQDVNIAAARQDIKDLMRNELLEIKLELGIPD